MVYIHVCICVCTYIIVCICYYSIRMYVYILKYVHMMIPVCACMDVHIYPYWVLIIDCNGNLAVLLPAMPAGVVTIQEMKITINVRKKIAIAGSFAGFCARFSEWFTARQKHWSVDFRRREVDNCGE